MTFKPSPLRRAPFAATALLVAMAQGGFAQEDAQAPLPDQPALSTATGPDDVPSPDIVMTLGAAVEIGPAYFGSDQTKTDPDYDFRLDFIRLPLGFEFGSIDTVGFRSGFGLSGSLRYISERESAEYEDIAGLDDVERSLEAGLGVGYEQRNYRAFLDVRYGIVGHNSFAGEFGGDGIVYPADGLTVRLGPRIGFGDDRFMDSYFGVSPAASALTDDRLEPYEPDAGLVSAGVELNARYRLNDRWGVEGQAKWDRLIKDAADSPVVESGTDDQYSVKIGVTRTISLDF